MIHKIKTDDGSYCYCISSYQVWRPGSFESERAARWAFQFDDRILKSLQGQANLRPDQVITYDDLVKVKHIKGSRYSK